MKRFTTLSLLVLCVVASSHGFAIKSIDEKKNLASSAVGAISNLTSAALQKKGAIIESVKKTAKNQWGYVTGIKDAKISAVKNVVASTYNRLASIEAAKQAFAKNLLKSKTAQLTAAYSAVSSKAQGLHQYKLNLKNKATALVSDAASKVYSEIKKKKELISPIKKSGSSNQVVLLQPSVPKDPVNVYTYVSHEPAVVGKVSIPEIPVQIYEDPYVSSYAQTVYGPPANTYGSPVVSL